MTFIEKLEQYARITVRLGMNVTPGRYVCITCPIICADFGRLVAKESYAAGAKDVILNYYDEKFARIRYDSAAPEMFEKLPEWQAERKNYYAREGCCAVYIIADDPEIFTGVESSKIRANTLACKKAYQPYWDIVDKGELRWNIVACPNPVWAEKVFPGEKGAAAVDKLWDAIFKTVRIGDGDCEKAWEAHDKDLKGRAEKLNAADFAKLHYKNSLGTDFTVGLVEGHIWKGGSDEDKYGVHYFANMPTEEIFTMPDLRQAEGVVFSAMPLIYNGNIIDKFKLEFTAGKVTGFSAERGEEALASLLDTDEGSRSLGEVALIPYSSPISRSGIFFYETLFDENASCHLALGECYPDTMKGGQELSEEELIARGGNRSANHVDFMIGTADMYIDGITKDGKTVPVFRDGEFVI